MTLEEARDVIMSEPKRWQQFQKWMKDNNKVKEHYLDVFLFWDEFIKSG